MRAMSTFFIIALLCIQCSTREHSFTWRIENVKTNYVQKGDLDTDYYNPPNYLIGKHVQIQDSLLILSEVRNNYVGSTLSDEFSDTTILKKRIFFKVQKDNEYTLQYPGDEFAECVHNNNDSCFISEAFLSLLEVKDNSINAFLSPFGKHSKTRCILFVVKENEEVVLFIENDFLLLFLEKK